MINAKKLELINELKALREEKGMSYQQIADKTAENNEPVSLSTIKLVFSKNNKHDHDYANVLKPIADVLSFPNENDSLDKKILQTRLELKDEIIEQLKIRLETKEAKHERQVLLLCVKFGKTLKDLKAFIVYQITDV